MTYSPISFNKQSLGSSRQTITNFQASTLLAKGVPVCVNVSGQLEAVNIASEASVQAIVGLTNIAIPALASGAVTDNGRLEDIITSFAIGDAIYINHDGSLTNTKPDLSVPGFASGMFVVFVGVVVKNEFNPLLKDLKLMISVIGQL